MGVVGEPQTEMPWPSSRNLHCPVAVRCTYILPPGCRPAGGPLPGRIRLIFATLKLQRAPDPREGSSQGTLSAEFTADVAFSQSLR